MSLARSPARRLRATTRGATVAGPAEVPAELGSVRRRGSGGSGWRCRAIGLGTMTWREIADTERRRRAAKRVRRRGRHARRDRNGYGTARRRKCSPRCWRRSVPREYVVLAARATSPDGPLGDGAARGALSPRWTRSLRRLGTDHLDLWQLPGFDAPSRWRRRSPPSRWRCCPVVCATGAWWRRWEAARHRCRTRPRAGQHHRAGVGAGGVLAAGATRRSRAAARGPPPRRGAAGLGPARPRRPHRQVRRRHTGRLAAASPRRRPLRRGPPQRALGPDRAGRPSPPPTGSARPRSPWRSPGCATGPGRLRRRRGPRRRSAHRFDGDRSRSRCPPRSAPPSTT